jgi:hypothetical protein
VGISFLVTCVGNLAAHYIQAEPDDYAQRIISQIQEDVFQYIQGPAKLYWQNNIFNHQSFSLIRAAHIHITLSTKYQQTIDFRMKPGAAQFRIIGLDIFPTGESLQCKELEVVALIQGLETEQARYEGNGVLHLTLWKIVKAKNMPFTKQERNAARLQLTTYRSKDTGKTKFEDLACRLGLNSLRFNIGRIHSY